MKTTSDREKSRWRSHGRWVRRNIVGREHIEGKGIDQAGKGNQNISITGPSRCKSVEEGAVRRGTSCCGTATRARRTVSKGRGVMGEATTRMSYRRAPRQKLPI